MFPHFGGGASTLPEIGHSLRFNSADSAYLSRTFGTPTSNTSWALSLWVKRTALSALNSLFYASSAAVVFKSTDVLEFLDNSGASVATSTPVYRDVTSHGHLFVRSNGTNIKGYWNGTEVISYTGTITDLNSAVQHEIGRAGATYSNLYLSRICFVDNGGSLTPSDFAYTDPNGQWRSKSASACKAVVDAGGTNSFMLDFDDGSSTATLGNDYSSKNNDWTLTNFTRSAGVNDDWLEDTPTNNFCVLSALDSDLPANISNGALYYAGVGIGGGLSRHHGTFGVSSGRWYFEIVPHAGGSGTGIFAGIHDSTLPRTGSAGIGTINFYNVDLKVWNSGTAVKTMTSGVAAGQTLQVAVDLNAGKLWFGVNNVWLKASGDGTTDPATGDNPAATFTPGDKFWLPFIGSPDDWGGAHINFGQRAFSYTPPTGFKALCTKNLPTPSIIQPNKHFDVKTYTGNAGTQSITGLAFQPDLAWMKSRGRAVDHALYDAVRGVQNQLESNQTGAETTETTGLTAFNSDGWTMGALDQINGTTATNSFVGWAWKANGAGASNTDGSITSTVSANQAAGFSIVTYTGTGANATVGHGLGVAPKMVIVKQRSSGTTENWAVWHSNIANTEYLLLNGTAAKATGATYWNSTSPTSSVFSVGTANDTNESTKDFVAYCFAEIPGYSKIGSYTGNSSTDGPFVWCGFRPKFILLKNASAVASWAVYDAVRDTYNVAQNLLNPDVANAESVTAACDATANGFKIRSSGTFCNGSTNTIAFLALPEAPFKFANAR